MAFSPTDPASAHSLWLQLHATNGHVAVDGVVTGRYYWVY